MKLTENFKLSEFEISNPAHGFNAEINKVPDELIENIKFTANQLQRIRDFIKRPMSISSGYRSPAYNEAVGGAKKSQHKEGLATDIKTDLSPKELANVIDMLMRYDYIAKGGLKAYASFVHVDFRGHLARW